MYMDTHTPLQKINEFYQSRKRMPTYTELAALCGFRSKNAAHKLAAQLVERGVIHRGTHGELLPASLMTELPVLGTVQAGFPSPAEEETVDTLPLEEYLMPKREATYLFRVRGDSMTGAGIIEGDLALVERGRSPRDGDIVLAEVDREWTLKYLRKRSNKIWLEPANKKYKPIYPTEELRIPAVLVSIVRKYRT